ncbi:MAG: DedA family protein [Acidimicrobiia bacterium]|nr:DedA family protein [Acidimicrobiia bacterium]
MNFLDPHHLINSWGLLGIYAIIFAESGLFFGFFLPGDSLLVTAGLLAAAHHSRDIHLNLAALLIGIPIAAILGDQVGYWFGARVGPALFRRPESRFFKPDHLQRANDYIERRGARMIVLARFIPAVRTFTPIAAGATRMKYRVFVPFNVLGGILWGVGVTLAGYTLGSRVKNIDHYLIPVVLVVIGVSLIPVALEVRRSSRESKASRSG